MKKMRYIAGIVALSAGIGIARADTPQYTLTDLTLGGHYANAYAINDAGQIAGTATDSTGHLFSFFYSNGTMTPIAAMDGVENTFNMDLNASGFVVNGNSPAFTYSNGTMTPLSFPNGSQELRVNDAGLMVVTSNNARAFIYNGTTFTPIGSIRSPDFGLTFAYDIANDGSIVGTSDAANGDSHAFLYKNGSFTDIGILVGGAMSTAYSINSTGTIVGSYVTGDWTHAFMYSSGAVISLETSPIAFSEAFAVNNLGVAVGVFGATENDRDGFIYQNGVLSNLNDLVALPAGYTIQDAVGINDSGQIIAFEDTGFGRHAVLLTPVAVPEPHTIALALVGSLVVCLVRWRRCR